MPSPSSKPKILVVKLHKTPRKFTFIAKRPLIKDINYKYTFFFNKKACLGEEEKEEAIPPPESTIKRGSCPLVLRQRLTVTRQASFTLQFPSFAADSGFFVILQLI